jgi:hypothetical protein
MQIILSQQCESLTGSLGKGFGYYITKSKKGYFSKRQALLEACHDAPSNLVLDRDYSAREVLSLNESLSLSIARHVMPVFYSVYALRIHARLFFCPFICICQKKAVPLHPQL